MRFMYLGWYRMWFHLLDKNGMRLSIMYRDKFQKKVDV